MLAKKNPTYRRQALGRKVTLDPAQQRVYTLYAQLRRQCPGDGGIVIPPDTDPLVARHLLAMDGVFAECRVAHARESVPKTPAVKR